MYLTQALKRSAQVNENGLATKDGNRSFTWKQSMQRISKLAGGLKKLDFKTNERAAILSLNSDRYFEILLSLWNSWNSFDFIDFIFSYLF